MDCKNHRKNVKRDIEMISLGNASRLLRHASIIVRDISVVAQAIQSSSLMPIIRRIYNKQVGKELNRSARDIFWRK